MMSFIIPSVQEMFNLAGFVCIPSQPVPCRALREWILEVREVKSEMEIWFTHFENEKWNENALISRSRVKSEMKMSRNRDREWKVNWKCLENEIEKWNFSRIFEKFWEILENQEIKKISNFVTNAFHLANFYSGIQQNAISESICHRGFGGWSLVETCMAVSVWMASFYWQRRAALIAEVHPKVHPIHPVQSRLLNI